MQFFLPAPHDTFSLFKWTGSAQEPQPDDWAQGTNANVPYPSQEHLERHWLLDHFIGRDVLISQLRLSKPGFVLPWYVLRSPGLDQKLDPQIDVLGYRYVLQPTTQYEDLKMAVRLFAVFAKLAYQVFRSDVAQMLNRYGK